MEEAVMSGVRWQRGESKIGCILALIIFGPGRVARLGSELGKGIRGFKEGLQPTKPAEEGEESATTSDTDKA